MSATKWVRPKTNIIRGLCVMVIDVRIVCELDSFLILSCSAKHFYIIFSVVSYPVCLCPPVVLCVVSKCWNGYCQTIRMYLLIEKRIFYMVFGVWKWKRIGIINIAVVLVYDKSSTWHLLNNKLTDSLPFLHLWLAKLHQ